MEFPHFHFTKWFQNAFGCTEISKFLARFVRKTTYKCSSSQREAMNSGFDLVKWVLWFRIICFSRAISRKTALLIGRVADTFFKSARLKINTIWSCSVLKRLIVYHRKNIYKYYHIIVHFLIREYYSKYEKIKQHSVQDSVRTYKRS